MKLNKNFGIIPLMLVLFLLPGGTILSFLALVAWVFNKTKRDDHARQDIDMDESTLETERNLDVYTSNPRQH